MKLTAELTRVMERDLPMPSLLVENIPYDKIILDSGEHQVRNMNIVEDETLTYQIEAMGLLNPIVLMPYGNTGKYVPVSGHTRTKSCKIIARDQPAVAKKHGIYYGMPAFVYKRELDKIEFSRVANVLNDHPKANTLSRADVIKQVYLMITEGIIRINSDGVPDANQIRRELNAMKLSTFSSKQLAGIVNTVLARFEKENRLNDSNGTIVTYDNKSTKVGDLLLHFNLSNDSEKYQYNSHYKVARVIHGLSADNSQWVGEHLVSFANHISELMEMGEEVKTKILYLHLTNVLKPHDGETAKETLDRSRKQVMQYIRKMKKLFAGVYMPDKVVFIPQYQLAVDATGKRVMGESAEDLTWEV